MSDPPNVYCAVCGRPYHRYSTLDPEHDFNAVACVNGLLREIAGLEAERDRLRQIVEKTTDLGRAAFDTLRLGGF